MNIMKSFLEDLYKISDFDKKQFKEIVTLLDQRVLKAINNEDEKQIDNEIKEYITNNNITEERFSLPYLLLAHILDGMLGEKNLIDGFNKVKDFYLSRCDNEEKANKAFDLISENLNNINNIIISRKIASLNSDISRMGNVSIICDIRPIFNFARDKILKYIYPITFLFEDIDKEKKHVYRINESTLETLKKEIEYALKKIKILKEQHRK